MFSWFHTLALLWTLYFFFWVIPRRLIFICRNFGTVSLFHLHRSLCLIRFHMSCEQRRIRREQSVPKRRHINFRRRGITQKTEQKKQRLLGYLRVQNGPRESDIFKINSTQLFFK
jgi:hypothetical protein